MVRLSSGSLAVFVAALVSLPAAPAVMAQAPAHAA